MLPLRSRTSWRLRALTVTCLPRDWTRAGVHHFANNRRRGHDLPEGHHGELVEQVWATRHTRQSWALRTPGPRQALSRRWSSSTGSLRRRHGHHPDQLRQQRSRQHHLRQRITNHYWRIPARSPTSRVDHSVRSTPGQHGRRLGGRWRWPRIPGMALRSLIVVAGVWQYWALLVDWRGGGAVR